MYNKSTRLPVSGVTIIKTFDKRYLITLLYDDGSAQNIEITKDVYEHLKHSAEEVIYSE